MTTLAVAVLLLVAYTYAGYPAAIALRARLWPHPVIPRDDFEPSVSACLAVSDGERHVASKLDSLLALEYPRDKFEIVIYDDGSIDDTRRIVKTYAARDPRIHLISSDVRTGKPTSINRMREAARGDVLLMTDVRQRLAPGSLRALLRVLADPGMGCVSGNLVLAGQSGAGAYWRYERAIREQEARLGAMVGVSGSIYALRRADLPELPADLILDDMYVPLSVASRGKRIAFARDAEAFDEAFDDEREFGRKVRTLAGNFQLLAKMPSLLVPWKNPVWFSLVSHKLLRLACPWALLLLLLASAWTTIASVGEMTRLELGFWGALSIGQAAFYALAAVGAHAGRVAGLARTFVVLNAAAVVGLWRFVRHTQSVTW